MPLPCRYAHLGVFISKERRAKRNIWKRFVLVLFLQIHEVTFMGLTLSAPRLHTILSLPLLESLTLHGVTRRQIRKSEEEEDEADSLEVCIMCMVYIMLFIIQILTGTVRKYHVSADYQENYIFHVIIF